MEYSNNQILTLPGTNSEVISRTIDNGVNYTIYSSPVDIVEDWLKERQEYFDKLIVSMKLRTQSTPIDTSY